VIEPMSRPPHVCIVSCRHVPDDARATHNVGMELRKTGFGVTRVGPERPRQAWTGGRTLAGRTR